MTYEEHVQESFELFGEDYGEIHRWLDEYAGTEEYGMRHRTVRHHEAGIQRAVALFGKDAGEAARRHIISDLKEEGWNEGDRFPRDEEDYVRMGFF
jgi:hypothetical protein